MHLRFPTLPLLISSAILLTGCLAPSMAGAEEPIPSSDVIKRIQSDGNLRLGMYLGFEGLSFRERGKVVGLEVELARSFAKKFRLSLVSESNPKSSIKSGAKSSKCSATKSTTRCSRQLS